MSRPSSLRMEACSRLRLSFAYVCPTLGETNPHRIPENAPLGAHFELHNGLRSNHAEFLLFLNHFCFVILCDYFDGSVKSKRGKAARTQVVQSFLSVFGESGTMCLFVLCLFVCFVCLLSNLANSESVGGQLQKLKF